MYRIKQLALSNSEIPVVLNSEIYIVSCVVLNSEIYIVSCVVLNSEIYNCLMCCAKF